MNAERRLVEMPNLLSPIFTTLSLNVEFAHSIRANCCMYSLLNDSALLTLIPTQNGLVSRCVLLFTPTYAWHWIQHARATSNVSPAPVPGWLSFVFGFWDSALFASHPAALTHFSFPINFAWHWIASRQITPKHSQHISCAPPHPVDCYIRFRLVHCCLLWWNWLLPIPFGVLLSSLFHTHLEADFDGMLSVTHAMRIEWHTMV